MKILQKVRKQQIKATLKSMKSYTESLYIYRISIKFGDKLNLAKLANGYQIAKLKICQYYIFRTGVTEHHCK